MLVYSTRSGLWYREVFRTFTCKVARTNRHRVQRSAANGGHCEDLHACTFTKRCQANLRAIAADKVFAARRGSNNYYHTYRLHCHSQLVWSAGFAGRSEVALVGATLACRVFVCFLLLGYCALWLVGATLTRSVFVWYLLQGERAWCRCCGFFISIDQCVKQTLFSKYDCPANEAYQRPEGSARTLPLVLRYSKWIY